MADNIQDPNERQPDPDPDRTEGTTGREEDLPRPDRTVPGEERERLNRPDERRDEGDLEADAEPGT